MSEENKGTERARVVDAMCMTWRHDFGLDRKDDEIGSCGMTGAERDALRRQMGQLYDHHFAARSLPVGVPDGYALVPVEPTQEMIAAVVKYDREVMHATWVGTWREYLAAAPAAPTVKAEQVPDDQAYDRNAERLTAEALGTGSGINMAATSIDELFDEQAPSLPAAGLTDLTAVRCQCCATEYPHDSYDAGFIAGSGMCQVCDAAMPPKDLPAAGSAVEEVAVVAWVTPEKDRVITALTVAAAREDGGAMLSSVRPYSVPCMTVAQHERIVAALSAQQSAQPEFCCKHSYKVAKQAAWDARDLTHCKCDHNEYCEHCWPDDFKEGGKWYNGFEAQQSAPERVSVPRDLLADLISSDHDTKIQAERALYALLASHAEGGKV